jgi:hypothetical protein
MVNCAGFSSPHGNSEPFPPFTLSNRGNYYFNPIRLLT